MKEKNLLYISAFAFFIIFSLISVTFVEFIFSRKEMSIQWENEQMITRLYQTYLSQHSFDSLITEEYPIIKNIGFYNYFGDSLITYGEAPDKIGKIERTITINRENGTITMNRDLLSPLDPFSRDFSNNLTSDRDHLTVQGKEEFLRYVSIEIQDEIYSYYKRRFRIIQVLLVLLVFIIIMFLVGTYIRNINYRDEIEANKRLVVLGSAARTLSHEIKNPLSIIRLQSSIIERSGCNLHGTSLDIINDEVGRITELTERVTDFLRQPIGVPTILELNRAIKEYILKKQPAITLNLPTSEIKTYIDSNRFISIIDNLINNAVESGSPLKDITLSLIPSNKVVTIEISDKGRGIDNNDIDKLLDPFFTTKSKGSGLGLAIVASYIHAAKGTIKINSTLDKGTTVTLTLSRLTDNKDSV